MQIGWGNTVWNVILRWVKIVAFTRCINSWCLSDLKSCLKEWFSDLHCFFYEGESGSCSGACPVGSCLDKIEIWGVESDPDGCSTKHRHLSTMYVHRHWLIFFLVLVIMRMVILIQLVVNTSVCFAPNKASKTKPYSKQKGIHRRKEIKSDEANINF